MSKFKSFRTGQHGYLDIELSQSGLLTIESDAHEGACCVPDIEDLDWLIQELNKARSKMTE